MVVRTKDGTARIENRVALMDFLRRELKEWGAESEAGGVKRVATDIEVITSVPFCLAGENDSNGVP
jgi:hypothetical protein